MNPNLTDEEGWIALYIVARFERDIAGGYLLDSYANLEIRDYMDNQTPLEMAIRQGREEIVAQIIEHSANY